MVLRWGGKAVVRAGRFRLGTRSVGRVFASMVGWSRFLCWLFARRSITQKEVALGGQVCAAGPLDDGCIAWQCVIAAAVPLAC